MELFIDTAEIDEIKSLNITGLIDGVTTNPSLIAKSGRNIIETIEEICNEVSGPVSAEVTATDFETMIKEGRKLSAIAQNVAIKVPLTFDGLRACKVFSEDGIMVNVTLFFNFSFLDSKNFTINGISNLSSEDNFTIQSKFNNNEHNKS